MLPTFEAPSTSSAAVPPADTDAPAEVRRSQFSLRGIFLLTGYFAIASALAMQFGVGVFVLMIGVCLMLLSRRGYLWKVQTRTSRPKLFGAAWLLFGISFALPAIVVPGCNTSHTLYGWEIAGQAAMSFGDPASEAIEMVQIPDSRTWDQLGSCLGQFLMSLLMNLPNAMMLASPLLLYRLNRGKGQLLAACLGCAAAASWCWGVEFGWTAPTLRIGYYLWSSGITLIALMRPPGWKTMIAMTLFGALTLVLPLVVD